MNRSDWLAIAALFISIAAVVFSGLQWLEQREQRHQQFAAALVFDVDTELDQRTAGIAVRNVGPGVARISTVRYYLDGRVIADTSEAFDAVKLDGDRDTGVDFDRGDSMAPGETDWLVRFPIKGREEADPARDLFENRLWIAIDYCPANGICATACSSSLRGACPTPATQ